jgi:23S rRNA-/tRNA-specific pseudouridylate synthase
MLIARNARALKRFGQQFQSRKIGKFYLAVVQHVPPPGVHRWQDHIRKVDDQARAELVGPDGGGRQAILDCLPVASQEDQTLLLIRLHTGRMHQIRIQAAARGFPILGDKLYGSQLSFPVNHSLSEDADLQSTFPSSNRLGLHALRLEFHHPKTAKLMSGTAALDQDWLRLGPALSEAVVKLAEHSRSQSTQAWSLQELNAGLRLTGDQHAYDTSSIDKPS